MVGALVRLECMTIRSWKITTRTSGRQMQSHASLKTSSRVPSYLEVLPTSRYNCQKILRPVINVLSSNTWVRRHELITTFASELTLGMTVKHFGIPRQPTVSSNNLVASAGYEFRYNSFKRYIGGTQRRSGIPTAKIFPWNWNPWSRS